MWKRWISRKNQLVQVIHRVIHRSKEKKGKKSKKTNMVNLNYVNKQET